MIDLLLRFAVHHQRDRLCKGKARPAIEGDELFSLQLERDRHHGARRAWPILRVTRRRMNLPVLEDREIKRDRLLGLRIKPKKRRYLLQGNDGWRLRIKQPLAVPSPEVDNDSVSAAVEKILKEVKTLSAKEREKLWARVAAEEAKNLDRWEKQVKRDSNAGKLDHLLAELKGDIKAGRVKALDEVINEP